MMSCNVSSQSWMNSMKLAQDNWGKGFTFEKSAQFIGSELLWMVSGLEKNYFNHCLTGWNSFHSLHIDVQAEKRVMDKTLTPSPWTTLMEYPKMDYP